MTDICPLGHSIINLPRAHEPPGLNYRGEPMQHCLTCKRDVIGGKFPPDKVEQKPEPRRRTKKAKR